MDNEQLEALERIAELKQQGILTDAEVEAAKRRILSTSPDTEDLGPTPDSVRQLPAEDAPKQRLTSPNRRVLILLAAVTAAIVLFFVVVPDDSERPTATTSAPTTTTRQQVIPTTTSARSTTTRQQVIPTTTSARSTTTRPAGSEEWPGVYGPGAWPNQKYLDGIGRNDVFDDRFLEEFRKNTTAKYHNQFADYQLFEMARNICGSLSAYGMEQVGPGLLRIREGLKDFGDGDRALENILMGTTVMIAIYCPEFADEYMDWGLSH